MLINTYLVGGVADLMGEISTSTQDNQPSSVLLVRFWLTARTKTTMVAHDRSNKILVSNAVLIVNSTVPDRRHKICSIPYTVIICFFISQNMLHTVYGDYLLFYFYFYDDYHKTVRLILILIVVWYLFWLACL